MIYRFKHFEMTGLVRHGFSTRRGGVSTGVFSSMNLGFARGDKRENVLENYSIFCRDLGIDIKNLVFSAQTHTTNVVSVTKADCGNGILTKNKFSDVDGLITKEKETALVTFYADCVPLYFLDPKKGAIGLSHAGWRGTLNRMAEETVRLMESEYNCKAEDILAGIGPSIGACCFETDEPVYSLFEQESYAQRHVLNKTEHKKSINLWEVNREVLINCGVKPENIEVMGLCTKCNDAVFYSHRSMGDKRGSLIAIMELI